MNNSKNISINYQIINYLNGNLSDNETQALEQWIQESDDHLTYYRQIKNIWETSGNLTISTDKALEKVMRQINHNPVSFWNYWQKIAAVLLIPLLLTTLWMGYNWKLKGSKFSPVYHKVVAAYGTFSSFQLPDGSKVWLNSGSTIQYPEKFDKKSRIVNLSGEAYFEVHSDKSCPFYVSTNSLTVKATGTRFNVSAYDNCSFPSVTLVEGKVAVQKGLTDIKNNLICNLEPQQHLLFNSKNGTFQVQTDDTYKYIAWKDGKLVFRNDALNDVVRRISQQYKVDIEIEGEKIKQYRYRATFENEPLSELLRLLKLSSPIDYREINPEIQPDGTFSKRKIIIFSANSNSVK